MLPVYHINNSVSLIIDSFSLHIHFEIKKKKNGVFKPQVSITVLYKVEVG